MVAWSRFSFWYVCTRTTDHYPSTKTVRMVGQNLKNLLLNEVKKKLIQRILCILNTCAGL